MGVDLGDIIEEAIKKIKYWMNNYLRKLFYEKIQFTKISIKNNWF